ncbi:MAG: hypothetical protein VXY56_09415 [Pseudomonadota bacterium]|nr:hypothetical protein [Pseudomonadota bacterium]
MDKVGFGGDARGIPVDAECRRGVEHFTTIEACLCARVGKIAPLFTTCVGGGCHSME